MKLPLSITSAPLPLRSLRGAWDTCPREGWTSTSVRSQGIATIIIQANESMWEI